MRAVEGIEAPRPGAETRDSSAAQAEVHWLRPGEFAGIAFVSASVGTAGGPASLGTSACPARERQRARVTVEYAPYSRHNLWPTGGTC